MKRDRFDLPLTTDSEAAASAYREGSDRLLAAWNGTEAAFERAIAADPDFALAYIARARMHATFGQGAEARACTALARELVAKATDRERGHVHVIASAIEGKPGEAMVAAEQHLETYPCDALVLVQLLGALGLYASRGEAITIRHGSPSASATPATMARTGGSWRITAGRTPKPASPARASNRHSARWRCVAATATARMRLLTPISSLATPWKVNDFSRAGSIGIRTRASCVGT